MHTENRTYTLLLLGWLRSSYEKDPESGLYYAGARYYNPKMGSFNSTDELWHLSPDKTSYHYCSNNPIMRVDPDGRADVESDDIVINGANNSSLTIKTDLVNKTFNTDIDFGGNHNISDLSRVAIGYEYGVNATGEAGVGVNVNASKISTLFLGGSFSGYWYDYIGAEMQINGSASAEASVGGHLNHFIAFNNGEQFNNPTDFGGEYKGINGSVSLNVLGMGINVNGQVSQGKGWTVMSLGASATIGPQIGFFAGGSGSAGGHFGGLKMLTPQKPTRDRSIFDIGNNWFMHLVLKL